MARAVRGRIGLQVPRVVDLGRLPQRQHLEAVDWALEEVIAGSPVPHGQALDTEPHLLAGLQELWRLDEVSQAPLSSVEVALATKSLRDLDAHGPGLGLWPATVDRPRLVRTALELLDSRPVLTYGLTHGDASYGNLLRLDDGSLALVDWEAAGVHHLGLDVLKALSAPGLPARAWPDHLPTFPGGPGARPVAVQVAVATLLFLAAWRGWTRQAVARGTQPGNQRRVHELLRRVHVLLGA